MKAKATLMRARWLAYLLVSCWQHSISKAIVVVVVVLLLIIIIIIIVFVVPGGSLL